MWSWRGSKARPASSSLHSSIALPGAEVWVELLRYHSSVSASGISANGKLPRAPLTSIFEGKRWCMSLRPGSDDAPFDCGNVCSALIPLLKASVDGSAPGVSWMQNRV